MNRLIKSMLFYLCGLLVVACSGSPPPVYRFGGELPTAVVGTSSKLPEMKFDYVGDELGDPSNTMLAELLVAAKTTVGAPPFQEFLNRVVSLSTGTSAEEMPRVVSGQSVLLRYLDSAFLPKTRRMNVRWVILGAIAKTERLADLAIIRLRPVVVKRWASDVVEAKACAINTVAHEWTHTVLSERGSTHFAYDDDGHEGSDKALVSYTVGAVAQCVFLQSVAIAGKQPYAAIDVETCVNSVGTTTFNVSSCNAGWADALVLASSKR